MSSHSKSIWKDKFTWIVIGVGLIVIIAIITGTAFILNNMDKETSSDVKEENITRDISAQNVLNATEEVNHEQEKDINAKEIIRIKSIATSEPNIAGGVDLSIDWINMSDRVIKYITFTAYPINAVGDIVECTIRTQNKGQFKGQETGPINKGEGSKKDYVFANAWYNNTIVKAFLMQVDIEYMDGSKASLSGTKLDEIIY